MRWHDAGLVQQPEVLGDVLLRRAEPVDEFADGRVAVTQRVEQLDAHRLAEDAKALSDQLGELIGERVWDIHAGQCTTTPLYVRMGVNYGSRS